MRRKDRELTDAGTIESFIAKEQIIRIGFNDNGEIYIVPVNYGYCRQNGSYVFYFHGAAEGRKYTLAAASPTVGFEIDGNYSLITGSKPCSYSAGYQSIIGTGRLSIVNSIEEKKHGLCCIMKQATGNAQNSFDEAILKSTAVFRLDTEKLSCKAHR